jgi:hypothetical protein
MSEYRIHRRLAEANSLADQLQKVNGFMQLQGKWHLIATAKTRLNQYSYVT